MNRRAFLTALALGSAGFAFDPERLLWVPGARTIFLPPVHRLVLGEWVTREAFRALANQLSFANYVNRSYDEPWVGQTVRIRQRERR